MALPLYPSGNSPGTHWAGGWVDPRTNLEDMGTQTLTPLSTIIIIIIITIMSRDIPFGKVRHGNTA
jgi:hypothetical protein